MRIQWRQELTTGNSEVDQQHHEMFDTIEQLICACKERKAKGEILPLLSYLKRYVRNHFSCEESYQSEHGVPHQREHQEEHRSFIRQLERLESDYSREGASLPVVTNSLMLTYEWLTGHIMKSDLEMARVAHGSQRADSVQTAH